MQNDIQIAIGEKIGRPKPTIESATSQLIKWVKVMPTDPDSLNAAEAIKERLIECGEDMKDLKKNFAKQEQELEANQRHLSDEIQAQNRIIQIKSNRIKELEDEVDLIWT